MRIAIIDSAHGLRARLAAAALATVFLAIYLPDLGRGFLKDDFGWVRRASPEGWRGLAAMLLESDIGFYRPLVMASFAADHALYGLHPFGYGITNLAVCGLDAALLFLLARRLSLPAAASVLAAAVWAFNFHGINMALLWLSGRTALLVVGFALATGLAFLGGRRMLAGVLCLCALLSKEEAVVLPMAWTLFAGIDGRRTGTLPAAPLSRTVADLAARTWPLWAALGVYLLLRAQSGAFDAWNAPDEYRLYSSLGLLADNVVEYVDRAGTVFIAVALILLIVAGRHGPGFSGAERRALILSAIWIPATFALTISLPVRSSLYVLLPSIGCALATAAVASRALRSNPARTSRAFVALAGITILLVPVYRARNDRWVQDAELSSAVVEIVQEAAARYPAGGRLQLVDDPDVRPNFDSAFLTAIPEVLTLFAGPGWTGAIVESSAPLSPDAVIVGLQDGKTIVRSWPAR